jgi:uncharacterized protein YkwD
MMNRARLIYQLLFLVFVFTISAAAASAQNSSDKRVRIRATAQIGQAAEPPRWGTIAYIEKEILRSVNYERARQGLKPLIWNDRVANMARLHSRHMADQHFFSHQDKDGQIVSNRANKAGITWTSIGENLIWFSGASDPVKYAVDSWMDSHGHRINILTKGWKQTGIGAVVAPDGSYYLTQVFLY